MILTVSEKEIKIFKTPQVFIWAVRLDMQRTLGTELWLSRERPWVWRDGWLRGVGKGGDVGQTAHLGSERAGWSEGQKTNRQPRHPEALRAAPVLQGDAQ